MAGEDNGVGRRWKGSWAMLGCNSGWWQQLTAADNAEDDRYSGQRWGGGYSTPLLLVLKLTNSYSKSYSEIFHIQQRLFTEGV